MKSATAAPARTAPRVRETVIEDYGQIAQLESANGLIPGTRENWLHLSMNNPASRNGRPHPIGWVLENERGRIVGSVANVPLAYDFEGGPLLATTPRGWVVDAAYRPFSLLLLARMFAQRYIDLYLAASAGAAAAPVYEGLRWFRVPSGNWAAAGLWLSRPAGALKSYLKYRGMPAAGGLALPLSVPVRARQTVSDFLRRGHGRFDVSRCDRFDDRFDEFWHELRRIKRGILLASRTKEVLEWHFRRAAFENRLWIVKALAGRKLVGYALLDRQDNPEIGLRRLRVVDFQAVTEPAAVCSDIFHWTLAQASAAGIHVLENPGCWLERDGCLTRQAPYHRALGSWSYYYKPASERLRAALTDAASWEPTSFDGDASL